MYGAGKPPGSCRYRSPITGNALMGTHARLERQSCRPEPRSTHARCSDAEAKRHEDGARLASTTNGASSPSLGAAAVRRIASAKVAYAASQHRNPASEVTGQPEFSIEVAALLDNVRRAIGLN